MAGQHIYPGQMVYYLRTDGPATDLDKPESTHEVLEQVDFNRTLRERGVLGNAFYRTHTIEERAIGDTELSDRLRESRYATPALPPVMDWLPMAKPPPPQNLKIGFRDGGMGAPVLTWEAVPPSTSIWKYAVYVIARQDMASADDDFTGPGTLVGITGRPFYGIGTGGIIESGDRVYVTSVSRNNVTSDPSVPLDIPILADSAEAPGRAPSAAD